MHSKIGIKINGSKNIFGYTSIQNKINGASLFETFFNPSSTEFFDILFSSSFILLGFLINCLHSLM